MEQGCANTQPSGGCQACGKPDVHHSSYFYDAEKRVGKLLLRCHDCHCAHVAAERADRVVDLGAVDAWVRQLALGGGDAVTGSVVPGPDTA